MGLLSWKPEEFWNATPHDFWRGFKGWRRANGLDKPQNSPMSAEERKELLELIERHKAIDAAKAKQRDND